MKNLTTQKAKIASRTMDTADELINLTVMTTPIRSARMILHHVGKGSPQARRRPRRRRRQTLRRTLRAEQVDTMSAAALGGLTDLHTLPTFAAVLCQSTDSSRWSTHSDIFQPGYT
eukprot:COSAG06_NODE_2927_length_6081_cov_15.993313_8_plen_116_part_00